MINYIEKGIQLHDALDKAGLSISEKNGVWSSDANHDDVNAFIAAFDPLPAEKQKCKCRCVKMCNDKIRAILPDHRDMTLLEIKQLAEGAFLDPDLKRAKALANDCVTHCNLAAAHESVEDVQAHDHTTGWSE